MICLHVEVQLISLTRIFAVNPPLQLRMPIRTDIRVPPHNHRRSIFVPQLWIKLVLCLRVVLSRLHMMMVSIDPEGALKNGIRSIFMHHDPCPSDVRPLRALMMLEPCLTLEDSVLSTVDFLGMPHATIRRKICHRSAISNDVVIRYEVQLYVLPGIVQVEGQGEGGERMNAMGWCVNYGRIDEGEVIQRITLSGVCYDQG